MFKRGRFPLRLAVTAVIVALLFLIFVAVDLEPDLRHLEARIASGPEEGNYNALASRLARRAGERRGRLAVVPSAGTMDNLARLARPGCEVELALVQDGVPPPEGALSLVARLPKSESVFFLGRGAAELTRFEDLRGMRIGIGPAGSGSDSLARLVFADEDFAALGLGLENHGMAEQLELLARGELPLGIFVLDEDAALVRRAMRDHGLELAAFEHLDVVARRHRFLWHGRIGAGQFDPIRVLPPRDHRVLRVDTLVVANDCASHAEIVALIGVLDREIGGVVAHNREKGASDDYPLAAAARAYFEKGGPELADEHVPWLVDIMPPANWVYVVMSLSLLFNLMGLGHRFRLWRIDAGRVRIDHAIRGHLGARLTPEEIQNMDPEEEHLDERLLASLDALHDDLDTLRERCRKQSLSMLVPMGQEMAYRYQEDQIEEAIVALRRFRERLRQRLASAA
jgi:hypothetical protein